MSAFELFEDVQNCIETSFLFPFFSCLGMFLEKTNLGAPFSCVHPTYSGIPTALVVPTLVIPLSGGLAKTINPQRSRTDSTL